MKTLHHIYGMLSFVLVLAIGVSTVAQENDIEGIVLQEAEVGVTELLDEIESRDKALAAKDGVIAELKAALEIQALERIDSDAEEELSVTESPQDEAIKAPKDRALESGERIRALEESLSAAQDALALEQQEVVRKDNEIARLTTSLSMVQDATQKERLTLAYNIGCIYKAGRQYTRAEAEFLKALEIAPDDAGTHYNLGILYDDNLGDATKAIHHYKRFLELAPEDQDAPNVVEWMSALQ